VCDATDSVLSTKHFIYFFYFCILKAAYSQPV
jgi:hypothetical protein